jgi:phytoene dehydrogenase-like protein
LGLLQAKLTVMSATDFLDEWFESERLKAPMSVSGIIGTFLGVRSPGTAYVLLHHYMGEIDGASRAWAFARGGNGAVSEAIAASARHHGAEIRVNAGVERVLVEGGRATGVVLSGSGDVIRAKNVISGAEPRLTFLKLVGAEHLPDDFVTGIRRYKARGSSGKVNLALDRLPDFAARPGDGPHLRGDISIAPSYAYLERAYDDAKYGAFSRNPFVNIVFPSLFDRSMAPEGKHVMSCFVQYAPYDLKEGAADWPNQREAFGDAVVNTLEGYMPGLKSSILHRQVLTPWDLEQEFGLTEGNIFHGELGLEQLMFQRPTPGWARYATPIRGLWLAGSGAHPGGGVMGAPGWLAAQEMLKRGAV